MTVEIKHTPAADIKVDTGGQGTALFSRYDVIDTDGDVTRYGFLPHGAVVPLLIGHRWDQVPVGKGKIRSEREATYFDFTLVDTFAGRELGEWLRFDLAEDPKQNWSYGFKILEGGSSRGTFEGQAVRFLHARPDGSAGAFVSEVSAVLLGAGVGTATVRMKLATQEHFLRIHAKLERQIRERQAKEQAEVKAMYARWCKRSAEINCVLGR